MTANTAILFIQQYPQLTYALTTGIQILGILVSFFISFLGYKAYKITNDAKHKYFFYGFLFLGLSFLANLALNVLLRSSFAKYLLESQYHYYTLSFFGIYYIFLLGMMLAYLSLAIVYTDMNKSKDIWLFYFWTIIIGIYTFTGQDVLFNIVCALLLSFVVLFTYQKYKENRNANRRSTFLAFFCLFLFHILGVIPAIDYLFMIRELILLIGLILLLIPLWKIQYGRKKK